MGSLFRRRVLRGRAAPCRRVHLDETQEEFWLRLNEEATRRQTALQAIENVQAAQYTFQPAINPKSRQVCGCGCRYLRCCPPWLGAVHMLLSVKSIFRSTRAFFVGLQL